MYLDDILVTGSSRAEHLATLEEVLIQFEKAGMQLKKSKCKFMMPEIEYLGHVLKPSDAKVRAISPTNLSELKAFLGLVNYYGKFLLKFYNLGTIIQAFSNSKPFSVG